MSEKDKVAPGDRINIELHVAGDMQIGGSMPVSWCLSKQTIEDLRDRFYKNYGVAERPYLLLSTVGAPLENDIDQSRRDRVNRQIAELDDGLAYVTFPKAGMCELHAIVVAAKSLTDAKKRWLECSNPEFSSFVSKNAEHPYRILHHGDPISGEIVTLPGEERSNTYRLAEPRPVATYVTVDVPEGVFAKEPPEWEKHWVNWLFATVPHDQCHYRRRRIFSYTVKPFISLGAMVLKLAIASVFTLLNVRVHQPLKIFNPISPNLTEIFDDLSSKKWLIDFSSLKGVSKYCQNVMSIVCMPLMTMVGAPLIAAFCFVLWSQISLLLAIVLCVSAQALLVLGIYVVAKSSRVSSFLNKKEERALQFEKSRHSDLAYLNDTLCTPDRRLIKSVSDIPRKKRKLRVRFQEVKAKVCKPYAGA